MGQNSGLQRFICIVHPDASQCMLQPCRWGGQGCDACCAYTVTTTIYVTEQASPYRGRGIDWGGGVQDFSKSGFGGFQIPIAQ